MTSTYKTATLPKSGTASQNRESKRNNNKSRRRFRSRKNYLVLQDEVIKLYRERSINANDVFVYAYLSSCKMRYFFDDYSGVKVRQERISQVCGISINTVRTCIERLENAGLITYVYHQEQQHCIRKYAGANTYVLKDVPEDGYFLVPRAAIFIADTAKNMVAFLFMCSAYSHQYGMSWNSYNDIADYLGYSRDRRSEIIKIVSALIELGLITKKCRKVNGVYTDNIYRIVGYIDTAVRRIVYDWENCKYDTGRMTEHELEAYVRTIPPPPQSYYKYRSEQDSYVQITIAACTLEIQNACSADEGFPF